MFGCYSDGSFMTSNFNNACWSVLGIQAPCLLVVSVTEEASGCFMVTLLGLEAWALGGAWVP